MEGQKTVGLNGNGTGFDRFARYAGPGRFVKIMFTAGFFGYLKDVYPIWRGRLKERFQTA